MKTVAILSEPLAAKELKDGRYEVWATAEAQYDDSHGELIIEMDSFVRPTDIRLKDTKLQPEWLPKKGRVVEHVAPEEAHNQTKEVFQSWARKVRTLVPENFTLGQFKAEKFAK